MIADHQNPPWWKNLKALALGFVLFRVRRGTGGTHQRFALYTSALRARDDDDDVFAVEGFRPTLGWRCFWLKGDYTRASPAITANTGWPPTWPVF